MAAELALAKAGERVTLNAGRNFEPVTMDVGEPCAPDAPGIWACECGEGIANNAGLSNHYGSGHLVVWMCFEHGAEAAV